MTDQQTEETGLEHQKHASAGEASTIPAAQPNAKAISAGLSFLMSHSHDHGWGSAPNAKDVWTTAYVLARLGDLPDWYLEPFRQKIERAFNWLAETQQSDGGWGFLPGAPADASSTAWAVASFRQHRRNVPDAALAFLKRCQRSNGSLAPYPEGINSTSNSNLELAGITAAACMAMREASRAASEFLTSQLRERAASGSLSPPGLLICSTVLDWEPGAAPSSLMNEICRFIHDLSSDMPVDQGLLLRCSLRLRLQRTWSLAVALRSRQNPDGSWPAQPAFHRQPEPAQQPMLYGSVALATVTALSAVAMGELQPGLYFGSDLPFRRLAEF